MNSFNRRRLLEAAGLSAGSLFLPSLLGDKKAYASLPKRLVIFTTGNGPLTWHTEENGKKIQGGRWQMRRPGLPETSADWEFPLDDPDPNSFSETLRPLHRFRKDLLIVDGLSNMSAYADPKCMLPAANGHRMPVHRFAGSNLRDTAGVFGGDNASVDQIIAEANNVVPFKYLYYAAAGEESRTGILDSGGNPIVSGVFNDYASYVKSAYDRVFMGVPTGKASPKAASAPAGSLSLQDLSYKHRKLSLDFVHGEYARILPRLGKEDRAKMTRHRDLMADLEKQVSFFGEVSPALQVRCERPASIKGGTDLALSQFIPAAMACDRTRVAIFAEAQPNPAQFGAPAKVPGSDGKPRDNDSHNDIAHEGRHGGDPAKWLTWYYAYHARQFARLVEAFKSVPEGNGTMLDNSLLWWSPECGSGWHNPYNLMTVMAGGVFRSGRYVKYAETLATPIPGDRMLPGPLLGPPNSKLLVSILKAFGINRNSIGVTSVKTKNGSIHLTGPLPRLT